MIKSLAMLMNGFESSASETPEFKNFFSTFKREFKRELVALGATDIKFSKGHFYVSGFFTSKTGQAYYFCLSDVRGMNDGIRMNSDSCMSKLLYRTADHYKDFTGGMNQYVSINVGMYQRMNIK